jgi:adenylosuccinate synthase
MLRFGDFKDLKILHKKLDFIWRIKIDLAEQILAEHPENSDLKKYQEEIRNPQYFRNVFDFYQAFWGAEIVKGSKELLSRIFETENTFIFEGSQGVLLDKERGFAPHVTQSNTTFQNALEILKEVGFDGEITKIGIFRHNFTRHGNGPFVTEEKILNAIIPDRTNKFNIWQGMFRQGWFDLVAARYALDVIGEVNYLALTNLDNLEKLGEAKVCVKYKYVGEKISNLSQFFEIEDEKRGIISAIRKPEIASQAHQARLTALLKKCEPMYEKVSSKAAEFVEYLERNLQTPIKILSFGPTAEDKKEAE